MRPPTPLRLVEDEFDEAIEMRIRLAALETALATSDRILPPSLRDFLD